MAGRAASMLIGVIASLATCAPALSADLGVEGELFEIAETNLFEIIRGKLAKLDASGRIDALNQAFADRVRAGIEAPNPVQGITAATDPGSRLYDPTVFAEEDYVNHAGRVVVPQGQRFNPLEHVAMPGEMIFIQGSSPEQIDWAFDRADATERMPTIILLDGRPLDVMREHGRQVFFDQGGTLARQFKIRRSPTTIDQDGIVLRISEHVVTPTPNSEGAAE